MDLFLRDVRLGLQGERTTVRIAQGRVAAIGEDYAEGARTLDGQGGTLLPGFVDAHVHMEQWASSRRRIPLGQAKSAVEAAQQTADSADQSDWVYGHGFRDGLWPDAPHKDLLERALPGRAVALFSQDLHLLWLSPAALAAIGREHPTGVLKDNECMAATALLPAAAPEVVDRWVLEAAEAAAARGVTGILDFELTDTAAAWQRRTENAPAAVRVACVIARHLLDDAIRQNRRTGDELGDQLTVGPYKLFVDGSLNTRTAYCHQPYPGQSTFGFLELPPEELLPLLRKAGKHGIVPAVHAIGDHANTIALDAFEAAGIGGRIEHAQLVRHEDLARFAALGVTAGIQPAHQPDDRDVADRHWHDRTADAFPYGSLLAAGARLEFGSDAPVAPLDPWDAIASAVTRTDDDRPAWHPEQRLSLPDALAAASKGRASINPGDVADLVLVAADLRVTDPGKLRDVPVAATILGGRTTYLG